MCALIIVVRVYFPLIWLFDVDLESEILRLFILILTY